MAAQSSTSAEHEECGWRANFINLVKNGVFIVHAVMH